MDNNNKDLIRYKKTYKELLIECNNLKKLLDTVDPMDIDFKTKIDTIDNLKLRVTQLHYRILKDM